MLLLRTFLPALATLAYFGEVTCRPQITATLPFVPDDDGPGDFDDLDDFNDDGHIPSGVIVGTGSAGETTYIVSASDDGDDRPVTATIIADGSGVTIAATYDHDDDIDSDDDDDLFRSVACGIEDDIAVCTYARVDVISGTLTTTSLATRTAAAERVTFIASTGSVSAADATETTGGTGAGAGTGTGDTAPDAQQTDASGARYNAATGLFASALSALFAAFALA